MEDHLLLTSAKLLGPDTRATVDNTAPGKVIEKMGAAFPTPIARSTPNQSFDRPLHAAVARFTGGVSPAAFHRHTPIGSSTFGSRPTSKSISSKNQRAKWGRYLQYCPRACTDPSSPAALSRSHRTIGLGDAWQRWPFNAIYQGFLLSQEWWHSATTGVDGVSKHHEDVVSFMARQFLDVFSPVNFPLTNPAVLETAVKQGGMNFIRGATNFWEDWDRLLTAKSPSAPKPFKSAATLR